MKDTDRSSRGATNKRSKISKILHEKDMKHTVAEVQQQKTKISKILHEKDMKDTAQVQQQKIQDLKDSQ